MAKTPDKGPGRPRRQAGAKAASRSRRPSPDLVEQVDGAEADGVPAVGVPASKRSLRSQGRQTMRNLLDAAMEAIDERGYHSTRVKDVVDIANTSHGTFYLYFSNKEDLIRALTIEATGEASSLYAVTEAGSSLDIGSWDSLRQWIGDYSALWSRYAPLFRSWTDLASIDPVVGDQNRRMVTAHIDAVASRIASAGPTGDLDPEVAGMAVIAMLDRFHFMREFMGQPTDSAALDSLTTMVHRALFPAAPR
ncbi:MAG TPA: TetR/AcrR family transcriptional regulator [Acidimicrobiales bacterium]|jgi:AcrR family transcriptional regulator